MDDPILTVEGFAGEPVELPVGNAGATGYAWQLGLPEGVEPAGETPAAPVDPDVAAGAVTGSRLLVTAPAGRYTLVARLGRPWEAEAIRTIVIELVVTAR